jgi:hypothetical protein
VSRRLAQHDAKVFTYRHYSHLDSNTSQNSPQNTCTNQPTGQTTQQRADTTFNTSSELEPTLTHFPTI